MLDPSLLPNTLETEGLVTDGSYLVGVAPQSSGMQVFAWNLTPSRSPESDYVVRAGVDGTDGIHQVGWVSELQRPPARRRE